MDDLMQALFDKAVEEWHRDTQFLSNITGKTDHFQYQWIISVGTPILPYIFASLEREPDHFFASLKIITGADPVPPEERGNIEAMRQRWLTWGREKGYHK